MDYRPSVAAPHEPEVMPGALAVFEADVSGIETQFDAPWSVVRRERLADVLEGWRRWLDDLRWDDLVASDRADALLLENLIKARREALAQERRRFEEMAPVCPFVADLVALLDQRRLLADEPPQATAHRLDAACRVLQETRRALEMDLESAERTTLPRPTVANRAARALDAVKEALDKWRGFRSGYDPEFTWWVEEPCTRLGNALGDFAGFLRRQVAGAEDEDAIIGDPVGAERLAAELEDALIPYGADQLIAMGAREMEWCLDQMLSASRELGLGDDWRAALDRVKEDHVPPGEQGLLVRDLAREAVAFVEDHDLLTIPTLAREGWRMEMMSPDRQKVNPFFLGGEAIIVSYPTNEMEHERKLMSMRGNNRHFSRATVQHELIPGHYMQHFCQARYRPYRRMFHTPFWTEGWTLYWEMRLWELGFPRTPEERIGMLFWRMHRCARVVFSLRFHLGEMSAQECVDMLVEQVGHERSTAEGEVRRSFGGDYPALYQCAYLIGGLQMRALHREMTGPGGMGERQFHDAVMAENCMPIAVLRSILRRDRLERGRLPQWRFDDIQRECGKSVA